jgi:hypothetical protein
MHLNIELRLNGRNALRRRQLGLFGFEVGDESHDLGGDLVAAFWSPGARHEAGQTRRRQRALSFVEGGPGDAEGRCDVADRHPLIVATYHLVADLDQIPGVKERVSDEERVADGLGMRIERSVACQGLALWVVPGWLGHAWVPRRP